MIPLSRLHRHISVPIWYLLIFFCFIGAIFLIQKVLNHERRRTLSTGFYLLAILITLRFLLSVVQRVQSDCLLLFLLSLFIYALFFRRQALAAAALAAATMIKLTPLIFLPFLLFKKRFKAFALYLGFLGAFLLLPAVYLGPQQNFTYLKNWLIVLRQTPFDYLYWYKNQSLLASLIRFLTGNSRASFLNLEANAVFILCAALSLTLFGLIFIFREKNNAISQSGFSYLKEVSLIVILMIIFSPLAWKHTFVHLIIAHLVLLYYAIYINPQDKPTRIFLTGSFILNTVLNPELTKPFAQAIQEYSSVTLGALLLYAALLRIQIKYANSNHYSHL